MTATTPQPAQPATPAPMDERVSLAGLIEALEHAAISYGGSSPSYEAKARATLKSARDAVDKILAASASVQPTLGKSVSDTVGVGIPAADYLAKVEADPKRAAALQRARDRAGVKVDATDEQILAVWARHARMGPVMPWEICAFARDLIAGVNAPAEPSYPQRWKFPGVPVDQPTPAGGVNSSADDQQENPHG